MNKVSASSPLRLLRRRFLNIFFEKLAFRLPWQPIKISNLNKIHMVVEDYSRNISVELFSKYLQ